MKEKILKWCLPGFYIIGILGLIITGVDYYNEIQKEKNRLLTFGNILEVENVGQQIQLELNSQNKNEDVVYEVKDPSVIEVTENGTLIGISEGTTTITVTNEENTKTQTFVVVVGKSAIEKIKKQKDKIYKLIEENKTLLPSTDRNTEEKLETDEFEDIKVVGISLNQTNITLEFNESAKLTATISPTNATNKNVTWTSSDSNLVSVDNKGNIKAVANKNAIATITAMTKDGSYKASATVIVKSIYTSVNVAGINLDKTNVSLNYNKSAKLTATISPTNATNKNVTWTSSDSNLVSVDNNGNIKAVANKNGTATITATTIDGGYKASATITVKKNEIKVTGISLNKSKITLEFNKSTKLTATISPTNATNKNITWSTTNSKLVSVDNNGNIKAVGNKNGTATITATTMDGYYKASTTVTVKAIDTSVKVTGINLDKNKVTLNYNKSAKLTATISPTNATNKNVTWISSDPKLVSVDNNGNIKAVANKNGTATITATTIDGSYKASAVVTVKKTDIKVTGISLNKSKVTLNYNKTTKLTATISPTNATNKNITWTSSDLNVATVSSDGTVTAVGKGSAIITATTKDGGYKATCTVTVDRKTYTVKFNSNGGSSVGNQSVLEGNKVKQPSNPTKAGYIFEGWLLNNTKYNFNTNLTSNITLTASWITDYNAVDYCSTMPVSTSSSNNKNIVLKNCIKDFVISWESKKKNRFMQNFSITSNYIYFSNPLNGAWTTKYTSSDVSDPEKYNEIIDSEVFETMSTVYITRINKSNGESKQNQIKYSGHGQGFDTISGESDMIYVTSIAHPIYNSSVGKVGAGSSGISYTSFKETGGTRVPGVTIGFKSSGAVTNRITSTSFREDGIFNSVKYFNEIKNYAKDTNMKKKIASMAIDEKYNHLVYTIGKNTFIYELNKVKNGTAKGPIREFKTLSNQGLELNCGYLYVVANSEKDGATQIVLYEYNIDGTKIKSVEFDSRNLYNGKRTSIEAEGLSIYNGKLYVGVVSREGGVGYNDIYLVEGFQSACAF